MNFEIRQDIESVLEITGLTIEELANALNVTRATVSNWLNEGVSISGRHLDEFYSYVYRKGIRLNRIKEQFYREDMINGNEVLLFHGAKTMIEGELSLGHNKKINDFGNGFYCGESLEQSVMFRYAERSGIQRPLSVAECTCLTPGILHQVVIPFPIFFHEINWDN